MVCINCFICNHASTLIVACLSLNAMDQLSLTICSRNLCRLCWQTCVAPASKAGSGEFTVTAIAILIKEQADLSWHPSSSPSLCNKSKLQTRARSVHISSKSLPQHLKVVFVGFEVIFISIFRCIYHITRLGRSRANKCCRTVSSLIQQQSFQAKAVRNGPLVKGHHGNTFLEDPICCSEPMWCWPALPNAVCERRRVD